MPDRLEKGLGGVRLEEIHSFLVLADDLHYTRAAARLSVTPGGLSRRINRLERSLGVRLLQRSTRRVILTEAGSRLLPLAERLVAEARALTLPDRAGGPCFDADQQEATGPQIRTGELESAVI